MEGKIHQKERRKRRHLVKRPTDLKQYEQRTIPNNKNTTQNK